MIAGPNKRVVAEFKRVMGHHFKMKDLGPLIHTMGVEVKGDRRHKILTQNQGANIKQVLYIYGLLDCNPTRLPFTRGLNFTQDDVPTTTPDPEIITDYRGKIGSLIYAMKQT